jgi:hypothetical protein
MASSSDALGFTVANQVRMISAAFIAASIEPALPAMRSALR